MVLRNPVPERQSRIVIKIKANLSSMRSCLHKTTQLLPRRVVQTQTLQQLRHRPREGGGAHGKVRRRENWDFYEVVNGGEGLV